MTAPSTTEERFVRKNDVKATIYSSCTSQMNHHLPLTVVDAHLIVVAIKARFGEMKQQRLPFWVEILPLDLNVKFLRSLPSEWDTHVVVWMNKPDFDTIGLDDLYNNFKIIEQKVKKSTANNNDDKNLAFLTTSSPSSTNTINTVNTGVSTGTTNVNTASTEASTASFSDVTVYAFLRDGSKVEYGTTKHEGKKVLSDVTPSNLSMQRNVEYPKALHYWVNSTRSENDY
ncbi:hypothetical protein Tco_0295902 [Tanacetum coccineum]|uniref:Uncharacterized protein n=1 Tax=Tanacetum coccineum TaxID=301880 RepID=A0ABQ5FAX1_9ASTR